MAHTKAIGAGRYGKNAQPKYRGVKLHDGQVAKIGSVIIRQTGSKFLTGHGVRQGSDYTIYSVVNGKVKFTTKKKTNFDGSHRLVKVVHVVAN